MTRRNLLSFRPLLPQDIKVIGALGDSITAGFGIDGFWGGFTENRGKSWAMGGDINVSSLASFVRRYSPSVQGASVGSHLVEVCADYFCPSAHIPSIDNLNAAQSGAWVQNLPDQATWLIKQMGANPKINWLNDWKLITVLIGANNLCASCIDSINPYDTAKEFGQSLDQTLATLATIPRTFVNVVQIFNLSSVYTVSSKVSWCNTVHGDFPIECECDFDSAEDVRPSSWNWIACLIEKANRELLEQVGRKRNTKDKKHEPVAQTADRPGHRSAFSHPLERWPLRTELLPKKIPLGHSLVWRALGNSSKSIPDFGPLLALIDHI